jgi:peptidoglycan/LPS O-acetylase OafA/YrhL
MKKVRLQNLEILRALAICTIVFTHVAWYLTGNVLDLVNFINTYARFYEAGLALFVFVSGFVLYYNYGNLESFKEITRFYSKRAIRIYPLYWLALIVNILLAPQIYIPQLNGVNSQSILVAFLGLQGFFPHSFFNTIWLWFVGVILIYYLIFPLLIRSKSLVNMFSIAIVIYVILNLLYQFGFLFYLVYVFYWVFFSGIALCWLRINYRTLNFDLQKSCLEIIVLIFASILLISAQEATNTSFFTFFLLYSVWWLPAIFIIVMISGLTYLNNRFSKNFFQSQTYGLIKKISIGAYATYLFHPTIFFIMWVVWVVYSDFIHALNYYVPYSTFIYGLSTFLFWGFSQNFVMIVAGIPLVFLLGYYLQMWDLKWLNKISELYQKYINAF